jgi:hypothetical protein
MPNLRTMPLADLDILTILMAHAWIDLCLGGEVGTVWATLDVCPDMVGPWTHMADIEDAIDAPDSLLLLAAHAEAWAMAQDWGRSNSGEVTDV